MADLTHSNPHGINRQFELKILRLIASIDIADVTRLYIAGIQNICQEAIFRVSDYSEVQSRAGTCCARTAPLL
jgi:hypothetical protein